NCPSRSRRHPWHASHALHTLHVHSFHALFLPLPPLGRRDAPFPRGHAGHVGHPYVGCKVSADNSHDQGRYDTPIQKRPPLCLARDLHFVPPLSLSSSRPTARSSSALRFSNAVSDR